MKTPHLRAESEEQRIGWKPMPRAVAWASCPCLAPVHVSRNRAQSGAALILVLASLIFISALTVAFLVSMRSKLAISKSGSDASEVKMLAETAVNVAISQVRDATKKAGANNLAWASQPGMIRLYDNSGNAAGYYKLYSADNMVATSGAFNSGTNAPSDPVPTAWADNPAVYTDLNAPANGVFPILDATAATALGVQGFSLNCPPTTGTTNPAPMPVKWLYVLEDGSLHAPDSTSSGTKAVIPAATMQNPIVGRIAFWSDDETCKVNVNTASEGTFWSTPRFNTTGDRAFATSQPARGEYQRYPGHPATVSLSALFPSLASTPSLHPIFDIAPRLSWGGSQGGTVPVQNVTTWITPHTDRLYASMDELLLKVSTATTRSIQPGLSLPMVQASRFFLTSSSRAPELNLFGLPRIATWPIHSANDTCYRTANDRLLAFCSTLGDSWPAQNSPTTSPPSIIPEKTYPFYFTRQENVLPSFDITLDRNRTLLDYLDRLTGLPVPGFGGNFQGKYTQPETRQILTEIFDYIRCTNLTDKATPQNPLGFWPYTYGISSYGEYAKGSQDMGRSRSLGTAAPAQRADWGTMGFGGRFLQVSSVHLHFVGLGNSTTPIDPLQTGTLAAGIPDKTHVPAGTTAVQAYVYLSTLNPSEGIEYWSPGHWIEIEGLEQFGIELDPALRVNPILPSYTPLGFPAKDLTRPSRTQLSIMGNMLGGGGIAGARVVGLEPFGFTFAQNELKRLTVDPPADPRRHFPFFSFILPVSSTSPTMAFRGGTITIRIYAEPKWPTAAPYTTPGALIQTLSVTFPDATFPTPLLATHRVVGSGDMNGPNERWGFKQYFEPANDVLRTVPLDDGDIRQLVGPTPASTAPFFKAEADYYDSTNMMVPFASSLDPGLYQNGSTLRHGKLIANASYRPSFPYIPNHINGVTTSTGAPGDWDNGTAQVGDGPFINAADPGSVVPVDPSGPPSYFDNSLTTASTTLNFASPNRQMPGPGMFGSLPTGVQRRLPWQTLLFRPGPQNHPGLGAPVVGPPYTKPPDHLLLDLFWMPVVEPYAISEPFSTAGKINMNQQLVPFTYIDRTAGLQAAMASEQVAQIPKSAANAYKAFGANNAPGLVNARLPLNLSETDGTLRQFKEKFAIGEIFRSASEICDIYLVPNGQSWASNSTAQTAWYGDDFALVGDNTRERPYAHLYNKLTTKSNTFIVHYHAQILQKTKARMASAPTIFDTSGGDKVAAAQRGATTFERYLDPADSRVVAKDPASATATSLEEFYRARIVNTTVFNP